MAQAQSPAARTAAMYRLYLIASLRSFIGSDIDWEPTSQEPHGATGVADPATSFNSNTFQVIWDGNKFSHLWMKAPKHDAPTEEAFTSGDAWVATDWGSSILADIDIDLGQDLTFLQSLHIGANLTVKLDDDKTLGNWLNLGLVDLMSTPMQHKYRISADGAWEQNAYEWDRTDRWAVHRDRWQTRLLGKLVLPDGQGTRSVQIKAAVGATVYTDAWRLADKGLADMTSIRTEQDQC